VVKKGGAIAKKYHFLHGLAVHESGENGQETVKFIVRFQDLRCSVQEMKVQPCHMTSDYVYILRGYIMSTRCQQRPDNQFNKNLQIQNTTSRSLQISILNDPTSLSQHIYPHKR